MSWTIDTLFTHSYDEVNRLTNAHVIDMDIDETGSYTFAPAVTLSSVFVMDTVVWEMAVDHVAAQGDRRRAWDDAMGDMRKIDDWCDLNLPRANGILRTWMTVWKNLGDTYSAFRSVDGSIEDISRSEVLAMAYRAALDRAGL